MSQEFSKPQKELFLPSYTGTTNEAYKSMIKTVKESEKSGFRNEIINWKNKHLDFYRRMDGNTSPSPIGSQQLNKLLVLVFGVSCSGKGGVMDYLWEKYSGVYGHDIQYVSRPVRPEERTKIQLTPEQFKILGSSGEIIYNEYPVGIYGFDVSEKSWGSKFGSHRVVLTDNRVENIVGALQNTLDELKIPIFKVAILAPDIETLQERYRRTNRDSRERKEEIIKRALGFSMTSDPNIEPEHKHADLTILNPNGELFRVADTLHQVFMNLINPPL